MTRSPDEEIVYQVPKHGGIPIGSGFARVELTHFRWKHDGSCIPLGSIMALRCTRRRVEIAMPLLADLYPKALRLTVPLVVLAGDAPVRVPDAPEQTFYLCVDHLMWGVATVTLRGWYEWMELKGGIR